MPQRTAVERTIPQQKSSEDLKAILRKMTHQDGAQKQEKQTEAQQSLKSALADVLKKSPEPVLPSSAPAPTAKTDNQQKQPFEIPEQELKAILKGDT